MQIKDPKFEPKALVEARLPGIYFKGEILKRRFDPDLDMWFYKIEKEPPTERFLGHEDWDAEVEIKIREV